jgi:hypothetical protein
MAGAMANAMIFVCLMVLTLLVGAALFMYAAYILLVLVQETAAGVDKIRWPSDPLYDKLPRAGYMACMLLICLAPAGLLVRLNRDGAIAESTLLVFFASATLLLWLNFPILLLSSLSAESPWIVFRATVLRFFARRAGAAIAFYFVTALLLTAAAVPLYFAFERDSWLFTILGAFVAAVVFLIYGRLLGRMAYLFDMTPMRRRKPRPEPTQRPKEKKLANVADPWAVPDEAHRPRKKKGKRAPVEGYAIAPEGATPQEEKPARKPVRRVRGYALRDEPLPPQPSEVPMDGYLPVGYEAGPRGSEAVPVTTEELGRRVADRQEDPPPAHPLISGVYSFPWYSETLPAWVLLSLGACAVCALLQATLMFKPW